MSAYKLARQWLFHVCGETIAITDVTHGKHGLLVFIEEVSKNGQEDTHASGCIQQKPDGSWHWNEGRKNFDTYLADDVAEEILRYIQQHGIPDEALM